MIPPVNVKFKPGYDRSTDWVIEPDSIWVYGVSQKVDTLKGLFIESLSNDYIENDINENVKLLPINQIKYETEKVLLKTVVKRFTEKSFETLINIKNYRIHWLLNCFPNL